MNIFFITSKLNFKDSGGSVEEFDLMIRTLIKMGNNTTVITAFSQLNNIPSQLPYKIIEENIKSKNLIGIQWNAYKIMKKYSKEADFFHIDGHLFLYGAGFYRKIGGKIPISAFFNRELGCFPEDKSLIFPYLRESIYKKIKRKIRWLVEKYIGMPIANKIDIRLFISPMYKEMYEKFGLRKSIYNLVFGDPIDFEEIMKKNNISEKSYSQRNKKQGTINLFFSSRMAPNKGFDVLLMAFSKIKDKEKFKLTLGGSGPEENLVRQMVKDLDLQKYINMPGWVSKEQLYQAYKEADIFIQPEWRPEGTSISLLYAMCFGLPSVLPGGGGLEWQAKKSAIYYKRGDYNNLAKKIEDLGNSYELREKLSHNCYLRLSEDEINHKKQIEKWYKKMEEIKNANK